MLKIYKLHYSSHKIYKLHYSSHKIYKLHYSSHKIFKLHYSSHKIYKLHYSSHKSSSLVPTLNQTIPLHPSPPHSFNIHFISSLLRLAIARNPSISVFLTRNQCIPCLSVACRASCPSYPSCSNYPTTIFNVAPCMLPHLLHNPTHALFTL